MKHQARLFLYLFTFYFACSGNTFAQDWEAYLPYDHQFGVDQIFHPETVKQRIQSEYPGYKYDLYEDFAEEISGLAAWNIVKGEAYPSLQDWKPFLEEQIKQMVETHGDTLDYHLQIVREPSINAYATAGGYVFMHVGLLAEARSMEEVVLVLGHELGHNFSQHAWEGYLDLHRASNVIMVTSFIGGLTGLIGQTAAISSYMNHSREDESEADMIAIQLLSQLQVDLHKGAGIYQTFMQQQENQRIRLGGSTRHWFYGSTHPAPEERYEQLMQIEQSLTTSFDHEAFLPMRKAARMERLYLLLSNADYRTAIETAWRYLIEEPGEQGYERMMFDALRRLNMTEEVPQNALVLCYNYSVKGGLEEALRENKILSAEAKETLAQILLVDDLNLDAQPFPLNSSFADLQRELAERLQQHDNPESDLLLALGDEELDVEGLEAYITSGGKRAGYAQWLIDRSNSDLSAGSDSSKTILMPSSLSFPGNDLVYGKDYEDFMDYYDWNPILQRFKRDGLQVEVVRKDKVTDQTPYTWEMLERFEDLVARSDNRQAFDAAKLDPDLGTFMMEREINGFVALSLGPARKFLRCDLQVLRFPGKIEPEWKRSNGICLGNANSRSYLSSQVLKRYQKLKP